VRELKRFRKLGAVYECVAGLCTGYSRGIAAFLSAAGCAPGAAVAPTGALPRFGAIRGVGAASTSPPSSTSASDTPLATFLSSPLVELIVELGVASCGGSVGRSRRPKLAGGPGLLWRMLGVTRWAGRVASSVPHFSSLCPLEL
jgi:hypothetical protein